MTVEEFKKLKPELADLEFNDLLDAMTEYMLQQQNGNEVLKQIMPVWKTHTLRWLFYRKTKNWILPNPKHDKYSANDRCSNCKLGVNARMGFLFFQEDGTSKYQSFCPHCGKEYSPEPNINISHKLYKLAKIICKFFWFILDKIHLIRRSTETRYGAFGDESRYVKCLEYDNEWNYKGVELKKRKWWEYIIIEKRHHNF